MKTVAWAIIAIVVAIIGFVVLLSFFNGILGWALAIGLPLGIGFVGGRLSRPKHAKRVG